MPKPKELPTTRWYPARIKPVRKGWYQAKGGLVESIREWWCSAEVVWRYWNGENWEWCEHGGRNGDRVWAAMTEGDYWRGLSHDPNAKERK